MDNITVVDTTNIYTAACNAYADIAADAASTDAPPADVAPADVAPADAAPTDAAPIDATVYAEIRRIAAKRGELLTTADGWKVSIIVHGPHVLMPARAEKKNGQWITFELGFPASAEPLLMEYAEDANEPTQTVYNYVPINVVYNVVMRHGGLAV